MQHNNMMQHNNIANTHFTHRSLCALAIVFTIVTSRPVYSKFVLPSRKSLEIIINIKKKKKWGCPLIRVCSLIRSNTVRTLIFMPSQVVPVSQRWCPLYSAACSPRSVSQCWLCVQVEQYCEPNVLCSVEQVETECIPDILGQCYTLTNIPLGRLLKKTHLNTCILANTRVDKDDVRNMVGCWMPLSLSWWLADWMNSLTSLYDASL